MPISVNQDNPATILIVDDNKTTRRILKSLLINLGYDHLIEATQGKEALQLMREHEIALIISDWNMPKLTGYELLKIVKSDDRLHTIPFIMVTSLDQPEDILLSIEAKVDDYIVKPFTRVVLEKKINKVLKKFCQ
jgi:two-component system chemotaxis response regulator CheY